jgi:hypothetical protein
MNEPIVVGAYKTFTVEADPGTGNIDLRHEGSLVERLDVDGALRFAKAYQWAAADPDFARAMQNFLTEAAKMIALR